MGDNNVNSKNDGSKHKKLVARRTKKWSQDARKSGAELKVMRQKKEQKILEIYRNYIRIIYIYFMINLSQISFFLILKMIYSAGRGVSGRVNGHRGVTYVGVLESETRGCVSYPARPSFA